jgi:hypothetical protein
MSLGWTSDELFAFREPFANMSIQGAAWFVGDKTIVAVTADAITLRTSAGSTQRVYRMGTGAWRNPTTGGFPSTKSGETE